MNKWLDRYVDEEGWVDKELTLNSKGFIGLTDDLEQIIDKFTGSEDWQKDKNFWQRRGEIRLDLMELIHSIANKQEGKNEKD